METHLQAVHRVVLIPKRRASPQGTMTHKVMGHSAEILFKHFKYTLRDISMQVAHRTHLEKHLGWASQNVPPGILRLPRCNIKGKLKVA